MNGPWLSERARSPLLEADLKGRGWRVWWRVQGGVSVTAPDGHGITVDSGSSAASMRDAYSAAREYAGMALRDRAVG